MTNFIGEYTCKLDSKGRILFPSTFKKQMDQGAQDKFVIKKDIFVHCLTLYTMQEWEKQIEILNGKINRYNGEHNEFVRRFYKGAAEVTLDGNNRLLLPKRLLDNIGAEKEIVLAGQNARIEIWTKEAYEKLDSDGDNYSALAERIMGDKTNELNE
ncbi:MAG: division/cell wall cluster transcriptional repressor MraZ [Bacteroidales bacterium]|nr:division/cell wall cluster transcriptional repressor MraZ [Bacteroidales bacterium]